MSTKEKSSTPPTRHVRGIISNSDGMPAAELTVVARNGDPNSASVVLGSGTTSAEGAYVIEYPDTAAGSTGRIDLFLVVFAVGVKPKIDSG
jgi:hypothetical protein